MRKYSLLNNDIAGQGWVLLLIRRFISVWIWRYKEKHMLQQCIILYHVGDLTKHRIRHLQLLTYDSTYTLVESESSTTYAIYLFKFNGNNYVRLYFLINFWSKMAVFCLNKEKTSKSALLALMSIFDSDWANILSCRSIRPNYTNDKTLYIRTAP